MVVLLDVRLKGGDVLILGVVYRSPSSLADNNQLMLELLKSTSDCKNSHILLMGDLNLPRIDWRTCSTTLSEESLEQRLLDATSYLHQHVRKPTRARGTDKPSLLDLVFSNEPDMVPEIRYMSPLGSSDHQVLTFEFLCYVDYTKPKNIFLLQQS